MVTESCCSNLGDVEVQDQLAVAEQLKKLSYVNSDRVGFWGWSYGGYVYKRQHWADTNL